jgi:hypothetical protein
MRFLLAYFVDIFFLSIQAWTKVDHKAFVVHLLVGPCEKFVAHSLSCATSRAEMQRRQLRLLGGKKQYQTGLDRIYLPMQLTDWPLVEVAAHWSEPYLF